MQRNDFRRFFREFQRYGSALVGYVVDVFRYDWKLASHTVGSTFVGVSLQAASLGAVLLVARQYESAVREGTQATIGVPLIGQVPASLALIAIAVLLAVSVVLLYESQRAMYTLSVRYANWRAGALLSEYPLVAEHVDEVGVDGRNGVPIGLTGEMSRRATALSRTGRALFGGALGLLQFVYGMLFLLYIQPLVTLALVLCAAPLVVPLRRFTRQINDAEKARRALRGNARNDMIEAVLGTDGASPGSQAHQRMVTEQYERTKVARTNRFILERFIGMARSQAIANAGLALTFVVSISLFFGLYGLQDLSISSLLVYFVALRVTAMGGRQLIARIARFGRFYGPVRGYLLAYHHGRRRSFGREPALLVDAPDADSGSPTRCRLERGVPTAVFGAFRLAPVNLHMLAVFADGEPQMSRGDFVTGMTCVPRRPAIEPNDAWRDWLPVSGDTDFAALFRRAASVCPDGAAPSPDVAAATPIRATPGFGENHANDVELGLLAAWASASEVVVLPGEIIDGLGADRWAQWRATLADRYLLIYYEAGGVGPCLGGEESAVLIDFRGQAVAIADADWLRGHADTAEPWVAVEYERSSDSFAPGDEDDED